MVQEIKGPTAYQRLPQTYVIAKYFSLLRDFLLVAKARPGSVFLSQSSPPLLSEQGCSSDADPVVI